jgi:hypothetical protein
MAYAQQESVQPGLLFKSASGLLVKTTGHTVLIKSLNIYVHEVEVVEGVGKGDKFLHNLDVAQPVQ